MEDFIMFSFFTRSSRIHVDCFTSDASVHKYTPVVKAAKAIPEWYESVMKIQKSNTKWPQYKLTEGGSIDFNLNQSMRTIRSCPGFLDLYKKGFIIESWCDFAVNVNRDGISFHYSNNECPILHKNDQTEPGFQDYYILKMKSPWAVTTKEDVQFLLTGPEWSMEDYSFKTLPGIINFHYQSTVNTFIAIKKSVDDQFLIPMGHPLIHLVPLSDKKVVVHNHVVTEAEWHTKRYNIVGTTMGWRRTFSLVKRNDEREKKCPFGFDK